MEVPPPREVRADVCGLCVILAVFLAQAEEFESAQREAELKAEFVERFTRFVDWPPGALADRFVVCVRRESELGRRLGELMAQRRLKGRPVVVMSPESVAELIERSLADGSSLAPPHRSNRHEKRLMAVRFVFGLRAKARPAESARHQRGGEDRPDQDGRSERIGRRSRPDTPGSVFATTARLVSPDDQPEGCTSGGLDRSPAPPAVASDERPVAEGRLSVAL